jgi:signal transduction histidine kinase
MMHLRSSQCASGERTDLTRVHRRVVRAGAVAAWFAAALLLVFGFTTGDEAFIVQSIGPIVAGGLMTAQILLDRENGAFALVASAMVVVVVHGLAGTDQTQPAAALALMLISSLFMLFVDRALFAVGVAIALMLMIVPVIWGIPPDEAVTVGVVMTSGFLVTSAVFLSVRGAAAALDNRMRILFEHSPTAVLEEDWSEAVSYVRSEYNGRPERVRAFLLSYPEVVRRAVDLAVVRRANRAAMDLLEVRGPEDLLGYRDGSKVKRGNLESFVDVLVALYNGQDSFEQEFATHTFRGRPIWLQARCVEDSMGVNPNTVLVALADISHVRAREEAMAELIKAKDNFIASISHELRTPLTVVLGLAQELSSPEMSDIERDKLLSLVSDQADEMAYIVEDLLVAARAEIGTVTIEPSSVDLAQEMRAALDGMRMGDIDAPEDVLSTYADPVRVRQILRNLLTNLNRYGGERRRIIGGSVGNRVWIEVRDNGEGVPTQDVERIFRPYATAHSGVTGSVGLGLSVARQLATLMGGSLSYRRDQGESVFRLELPIDRATALVSASRAAGG